MNQLGELKKNYDGPFTDVAPIEEFLADSGISPEDKKRRMKIKVQYARDTSTSIPHSNPVFQIRTKKQPGKKARDLTAEEFGENLKNLINKRWQRWVKMCQELTPPPHWIPSEHIRYCGGCCVRICIFLICH